MTELDSKNEISLEEDTILSKLGKLTAVHSPRVIHDWQSILLLLLLLPFK